MSPVPHGFYQLLLVAGLCWTLAQPVHSERCNLEVPFDFTMLALQWPSGTCYHNNKAQCIDYQEKFTIHGNWPSFSNGSWPEMCCFQNFFDKRKLEELESRLKDNWPSLFVSSGGDESFWRHEWKKHGTCAATVQALKGQRQYFTQTLEMYEQAKIQEWLAQAKIVPSLSSKTSTGAVHKAIESKTRHRIRLECRRLPKKLAEAPILSGVYLCYDPSHLEYMDCPQPDDPDCGTDQLLYLPKPSSSSGQYYGFYSIAGAALVPLLLHFLLNWHPDRTL